MSANKIRNGWKTITLSYPGELRIGQNLSNFLSHIKDKEDIYSYSDTKFLLYYNEYLIWLEDQNTNNVK